MYTTDLERQEQKAEAPVAEDPAKLAAVRSARRQ